MAGTRKTLMTALQHESGLAMALALVTIFIILIVSGTMVALAMNEYHTAGAAERSRQAIQVTEAGIEVGLFELKRDTKWDDSAGATQNVTAPGQWFPLWDGTANVVDRQFMSSPLGRFTLELCRYDDNTRCPGVPDPVPGSGTPQLGGCGPDLCIYLRSTGRVLGMSRQVEVLLGKFSAGSDLINYSAGAINIGAGGGGNGSFTLHGSLYIATCVVSGGECIGLNMQGTGEILNDMPFPTPGDPDTNPPFNNRVFVNGRITGQGASWLIGLAAQPMRGVHATGMWPSSNDSQINALEKSSQVPLLPFPDPSKLCEASGTPRTCLINRLYLPAGDSDRIVPANTLKAYVCTISTGCAFTDWQEVSLDDPNAILRLCSADCGLGTGVRTKVLIPDRDPATGAPLINCTDSAQAALCNSANGALADVDGSDDFSMVFNGYTASGTNFYAQRDAYVHSKARMRIVGNVRYTAFTTFLIENTAGVPANPNTDPPAPLQLEGSVTPLCRVSQGLSCTQTFGQSPTGSPPGDVLAFTVGPACTSPPPIGSIICLPTGGSIYTRGAQVEQDLLLFAHGTLKDDNPQVWYGLFIAGLIDWDNNPQIYPVPGLQSNVPPGVVELVRGSFGILYHRWREVF